MVVLRKEITPPIFTEDPRLVRYSYRIRTGSLLYIGTRHVLVAIRKLKGRGWCPNAQRGAYGVTRQTKTAFFSEAPLVATLTRIAPSWGVPATRKEEDNTVFALQLCGN